MENILLRNHTVISVPEEICENKSIFFDVLSLATWEGQLTQSQRQHLSSFLPTFPSDDDNEEKNETLRRLFAGENMKFGNQMHSLFKKMNEGLMSPAIARLGRSLKKAAYKEYCLQQKRYFSRLLQPLLLSRMLLLKSAQHSSPDAPIGRVTSEEVLKEAKGNLENRTRWRYFTELQEVREEAGELYTSSEDENFPGPPPKLSRKHKKHLQFLESSLGPDMHRILPTTAPPTKAGHIAVSPSLAMLELTEERYRHMLQNHQFRRIQGDLHPELDTSKITLEGVMQRAAVSRRNSNKSDSSKRKWKTYDEKKHKQRSSSSCSRPVINTNVSLSPSVLPPTSTRESPLKEPSMVVPEASTSCLSLSSSSYTTEDVVPFQASGVSGPAPSSIDPPSEEMEVDVGSDVEGHLVSGNRNGANESDVPVTTRPSSFFALLRDLFYELPEQKMSVARLEERVRSWMETAVAVTSLEWMSHSDPWVDLVSSALKFLAGDLLGVQPENFVPYLDYREKQQQWQWIGAGRDTDELLNPLCQHWIDNKDDLSLENLETCQGSPPPARVATDWTVKPTSEDEKLLYRQQECIRYQNPHKAFTFRVHGYESVVGPVKGVYGKESGVNKAREHSLLISDRPPFVTILSLVRDSAARLPNGEGTRADICELLKDSQYLATASEQQCEIVFQIHTVVSGALDRLHYEKDPCVKYDTNRKLWIYLHRHRTEEEFEKIHQAQAAAAKAKKAMQKSKPQRSKPKDPRWNQATDTTQEGTATSEPSSQHTQRSSGTKGAQTAKSGPSQSPRKTSGNQLSDLLSSCTSTATSPLVSIATTTASFASSIKETPICNSLKASVGQDPHPDSLNPPCTLTIDVTTNTESPSFMAQPDILQPLMELGNTAAGVSQPIKSSGNSRKHPPGTLQGFQTIVIKQEPSSQKPTNLGTPGLGATQKTSVMARIVSGTQMVSLGNLVGEVPALRFQGANYVRPNVSPTSLNILQTASSVANRFGISKFALVSPSFRPSVSGATAQIPVGVPNSAVLTGYQEKSPGAMLTPGGTLKLVASASSTLGGTASTLTTTALMSKVLSPAISSAGTAMVTMTTSGSIPSVIIPGTNPVMIASQASLKPSTQAYVMAGANPASLKALQGIKVIPVSQAVNALRGKGGQTPLLARIITPSLALQSSSSSATTHTMGIVHHSLADSTSQMIPPKTGLCPSGVIVQVHTPVVSSASTLPNIFSKPNLTPEEKDSRNFKTT